MAEEGEVEIIDCGVQSVGSLNQSSTPETGALVEVTFQKDPDQKNKYLEAEPKALGISQIMLTLFIVSVKWTSWKVFFEYYFWDSHLLYGNLVLFGLIAGSVAVAAQNLHLPTLKACLGVQVVMCAVSVICLMGSSTYLLKGLCMHYQSLRFDPPECYRLEDLFNHVMGVLLLAQAAQVALSATLAVFCCKVIQCCNPQTNVPVIAVNTPQAPQ